jgi:hypothetical protein
VTACRTSTPTRRRQLLFNKICGPVASGGMNMDMAAEGAVPRVPDRSSDHHSHLFTRTRYTFNPAATQRSANSSPRRSVGVMPAEHIRVLSNDIFGNGELAYEPTDAAEGLAGGVLRRDDHGRPQEPDA